ncbi:mga helix-turn-helix domain-containing protein [Listeria grandensis FSL F6-0971]|uniref:Mga helix-turn-helix domain-containing protein n=1 Tax=Listeria grandensis FSL F6-0971 TaxID=1265819 RepID=W7B5X8_9LIST|nr:helix-turn-helix domain-containing protein [Listeria grandensis]EUJ18231.1 mga helix-turn-helix domain-containing protein [Listeria grandensis FSL F6-0971]
MRSIIPSSAYRRLKILNLLFFTEEPLTKREVVGKVLSSINTLNADIEILNTAFPSHIAQIAEVKQRLMLTVGEDINFDYLTAYMVGTSDLFHLTEALFNGDHFTPVEWSERNYIGLTNLYARLKEIDSFLAKSRLILNSNPLQILGNEINIRFFFFHLFSKSYPYKGWIPKDFTYAMINRFIKKMERYLEISFSLSTRMDYAIAISVCLTRIKQGNMVQLENGLREVREVEQYYDASRLDFSDLEKGLGVKISKEERYFILMLSSLAPFSYVNKARIDFRIKYHKTYRPDRYNLGVALASLVKDQVEDIDAVLIATLDYLTRFSFVDKKHLIVDVEQFSNKNVLNLIDKDRITKVLTEFEKKIKL